MAVVRYTPWGVDQLQNEINRLFRDWSDNDSSGATASWMPRADIQEFGDRFELYVDLPGVDPGAVEITLDNGVLTIAGERTLKPAAHDEETVSHRRERAFGQFHRRFILPETADSDNVKAAGRNGVLEVVIPKQAKAQPRRISVNA